MAESFSHSELEAYLDEALPPDDMARVEQAIRDNPELVTQLSRINGRRDAGIHTLGEIWRRNRVSCPARNELAGYLLNTLDSDAAAYVEFHTQTVGCRYCEANLNDLRQQHGDRNQDTRERRKRYYDTSAGFLKDSK